ncbi:RebB family R body protein [Vibrio hepatarius]|uniref:RebB family R body protein n=1 Tax=Vibrio hepatarius TaxID=171383 RepID=UPI001C0885CA|nr:RebB family R body protein [Vibrio hepatarius]MBU2899339.1 RebB family R body protein [Vibrio hepatarius]
MSDSAATVNAQVTDSITQVNTKVVGDTPAMAMSNLLMSTSHALGATAHNVTTSQQQWQITMQAATVQGVNSLVSVSSAALGLASETVLEKN